MRFLYTLTNYPAPWNGRLFIVISLGNGCISAVHTICLLDVRCRLKQPSPCSEKISNQHRRQATTVVIAARLQIQACTRDCFPRLLSNKRSLGLQRRRQQFTRQYCCCTRYGCTMTFVNTSVIIVTTTKLIMSAIGNTVLFYLLKNVLFSKNIPVNFGISRLVDYQDWSIINFLDLCLTGLLLGLVDYQALDSTEENKCWQL